MNNFNSLETAEVTLSMLLGSTVMPMHQLLRLGRGAVIELNSYKNGSIMVLANGEPFARAEIRIDNEKIGVAIQEFFASQNTTAK